MWRSHVAEGYLQLDEAGLEEAEKRKSWDRVRRMVLLGGPELVNSLLLAAARASQGSRTGAVL